MSCRLCTTTPVPKEYGSPRQCAFESGTFSSDNWNCETANAIRGLMEQGESYKYDRYRTRNDDESFGVLYVPRKDTLLYNHAGFFYIVATWYKERGKTSQMYTMIDDDTPKPLTLKQAEATLAILQ